MIECVLIGFTANHIRKRPGAVCCPDINIEDVALSIYAVFSSISPMIFDNATSSMLMSGQHTASVGIVTVLVLVLLVLLFLLLLLILIYSSITSSMGMYCYVLVLSQSMRV